MNQYKLNLKNNQGKLLSATVKANSLEEAYILIKKKGFEMVDDSSQNSTETQVASPKIKPSAKPIRKTSLASPKKPNNWRDKVEGKSGKRIRRKNITTLSSNEKKNIFGIVGIVIIILFTLFLINGRDQNASKPVKGWDSYSAKESSFTVFLPHSAQFEKKIEEGQHIYIYNDHDRAFMIIFTKYSFLRGISAFSEKQSNSVLDTLVSIATKHVNGSIKSKKYTNIKGYNAIDVIVQADDLTFSRMMNILTPKGSYSIGISCLNDSVLNDQTTNAFINSIEFN